MVVDAVGAEIRLIFNITITQVLCEYGQKYGRNNNYDSHYCEYYKYYQSTVKGK